MKKMMMTLAIVLAAVYVNAASVNWQSGILSAMPSYATVWQGQSMSCFLVGSAAYDTSALITSLSNGGALPGGADFAKVLSGTPSFGMSGLGAKSDFVTGNIAYGYAVVYNKAGNQFAISKVGTSLAFPGAGSANLALGGTANFLIYSVVPEPTSMALLALGAAAIGLRRRYKK